MEEEEEEGMNRRESVFHFQELFEFLNLSHVISVPVLRLGILTPHTSSQMGLDLIQNSDWDLNPRAGTPTRCLFFLIFKKYLFGCARS